MLAPDDGGPVDEPCTTPHPITEEEVTHTELTDTVTDTVTDAVLDADCVGVVDSGVDVVLHNHDIDVDTQTATKDEGSFI